MPIWNCTFSEKPETEIKKSVQSLTAKYEINNIAIDKIDYHPDEINNKKPLRHINSSSRDLQNSSV